MKQHTTNPLSIIIYTLPIILLIIAIVFILTHTSHKPPSSNTGLPDTWSADTHKYLAAQRQLATDLADKHHSLQARQILTKLLTNFPNDDKAHRDLSLILIAQNDWPNAYKHAATSLTINPNQPDLHYTAGTIAETYLKKLNDAKQHYTAAVKLKPTDSRFTMHLANISLKLKDYTNAQFHALLTIKLNPSLHQPYGILAESVAQQGKLNMAVEQYSRAISLTTNPQTHLKYSLRKAQLLRRDNQPDLALAILTQLTKADHSPAENHKITQQIAQCHLMLSQPTLAAEAWLALLIDQPLNAEAAAQAAICYHHANNIIKAQYYLNAALQLDPQNPTALSLQKSLKTNNNTSSFKAQSAPKSSKDIHKNNPSTP